MSKEDLRQLLRSLCLLQIDLQQRDMGLDLALQLELACLELQGGDGPRQVASLVGHIDMGYGLIQLPGRQQVHRMAHSIERIVDRFADQPGQHQRQR
ncbi:hypothetical protein D3C79_674070 [compost metagenome]